MDETMDAITARPDKDARTWAMAAHLATFAGYLLPALGFLIGPLVVWLIKKNDHPFIDAQGREAVNFNLSMLLWAIVSGLLCLILIGIPLLILLGVLWIILPIVAAVKASDGVDYRYPLTIRFF